MTSEDQRIQPDYAHDPDQSLLITTGDSAAIPSAYQQREAIDNYVAELRSQVGALKEERDAYREALREYSNLGNWDVRRTAKGDLVADVWMGESGDGYDLATSVLVKYATTAPEG